MAIRNRIESAVSKREAIAKRLKFIQEQEAKAQRRKPLKSKLKTGTLFAKRNKRQAIREGALRRSQIIITFTKTTTGEKKKYIVAPYEIKFRRLKVSLRKSLWAWDMSEKRIKSFAISNIHKVALTDRKYKPKWEVKFK